MPKKNSIEFHFAPRGEVEFVSIAKFHLKFCVLIRAIVKNIFYARHPLFAPDPGFDDIIGSVISFRVDCIDPITDLPPNGKLRFNSDEIQKFIILILSGIVKHEELSLKKIGIDPCVYDPKLSEITPELNQSLNNFYFYISQFIKYFDFKLKYNSLEFIAPPPEHKVWQRYKTMDSEPSLKYLCDNSDYRSLIILSMGQRVIKGHLDRNTPLIPVKFVGDAAKKEIGEILRTILKGMVCLHNEICYFTQISEIIYPPGYDFDPDQRPQRELLFESQREPKKIGTHYWQPGQSAPHHPSATYKS